MAGNAPGGGGGTRIPGRTPKPQKPPMGGGNAPGGGGGNPGVLAGRSGMSSGRPTLPGRYGPAPGGGGQKLKPVGYGLNGNPFYDRGNYLRSAAYKESGAPQRIQPPGGGREFPLVPPQRVPGASPTFPHTGAAAAPGTADQHFDQVRQGIVNAGRNGGMG